MKNKKYWPSSNDPVWLEEGYRINESVFCETFISTHKIVFCNGFFFTEDGRVTDEMPLRSTIYSQGQFRRLAVPGRLIKEAQHGIYHQTRQLLQRPLHLFR